MDWLVDHLLWVFVSTWAVAAVMLSFGLVVVWRWVRPREGTTRRFLRLVAGLALTTGGALVLVIASSVLVAMGPSLFAQARMIGDPAPELVYTRVADGTTASLADLRGSVVLVNQWATWCPPCRQEMPELERLQAAYRGDGLIILNISDEPEAHIARWLAQNPMTTEHGRAAHLPWPAPGRPTTFVVDRDGVVRSVVIGARSYERFEALVTPFL